ncbi:hypothetical protein [Streptomyces zaomyceticus]|uniref:hypothetical protein n=1 Tax=Streptomyces zaomyceticus TaxID=68286 RepID=UPI002E0D9CB4
MASVLGMLEERETAARVRVEGLREEAARLAGVLEAAEIELDRRVIAREELMEGPGGLGCRDPCCDRGRGGIRARAGAGLDRAALA